MSPKTDRPHKASPREASLPSRTKSFVLQGSTAAKVEALAEALHQSESAIVNEILEKAAAQMILERAPDLTRRWPPLRHPTGRIEGALRIRRPDTPESEGTRTYSLEIIQEIADRPAILVTLAYIYDADRKIWRRLADDEATQLVRDIHSDKHLSIVTSAGIRWALIEARDLVNRDFVPPLRDVLVRLRRVPADLCPLCGSTLAAAQGAALVAAPAASYFCTNPECRRLWSVDRVGNLVPAPGSPESRPKSSPLTFAQLRGIIPSGFTVSEEDFRNTRAHRREIP